MEVQAGEQVVASRFRPDIEGLRGIAVLLVVLYHAQVGGLRGGYIGVDVFFVLSGYLISGLLIAELDRHGRIGFRGFYARRIRRLLPASALVLVSTVLVGLLLYSPLEVRKIARTGSTAALYASNLFFAERSTVYLDQSISSDPFLHTWSLAVEEQFYVLWPVLIFVTALVGRRWWTGRAAVAAMMALLFVGSFAYCIWLTGTKQPSAFFLSLPRFWEFAAGGLAAMAPGRWFSGPRMRNVIGGAGLGLVAVAALTYSDRSPFPGFLALLPVLGTALVLVTGGPGAPTFAGRLVSQKALLWFGRHSYSWYLWHWPVLILAGVLWPAIGVGGRILAVVGALALSDLTLRLIENPVRYSRALTARPLLCIGGAIALTAVSVGAAQASSARAGHLLRHPAQAQVAAAARDLPAINPRGCVLPFEDVEPGASCSFGDIGSATIVVLFGDSHAGHLFPAMEAVALARGWRLDVHVKAACPSAMLGPDLRHSSLGRRYSECMEWRARVMDEIEATRPAMVVMSNSSAYVERDGGPRSFGVGATAWGGGIEATARRFAFQGIQTVLVADTPRPGFDVPSCVSRLLGGRSAPSSNCEFDRWKSLNPALRRVEARAIERVPGAVVLDLNASICAGPQCNVRHGNLFIYRDNNHLTARFSRSLAPILMEALAQP